MNGLVSAVVGSGTCSQVILRELNVEVGTPLGLLPEHLLSYLALRIQLNALKDDLLELMISCTVDKVSAMEIYRLVIQSPCRELLPVLENSEYNILSSPVKEHLACSGSLTACTSAEDNSVELLRVPGPCACRTYPYALSAAYAAAVILDGKTIGA